MVVPEAVDAECALAFHLGVIIRFAAVFVGVFFLIFLGPNILSEVLDGDFSNLPQAFLGIVFLAYGIFGKDWVSPKKK